MDSAPAVEVCAGSDATSRSAVVAMLAAVTAMLIAWTLAWAGMSTPLQAVAAVAGACASAVACARVWPGRCDATALLRWDGRGWQWVDGSDVPPVDGVLAVALDLDAWVLLCFDGADEQRRWLAVSRARHRARWHALRCAMHAHGTGARPVTRVPV